MKKGKVLIVVFVFIAFLIFISNLPNIGNAVINKVVNMTDGRVLNILSSNDNKDLESSIKQYAKKEGFSVEFTYMGDLDITEELNSNSDKYDAVWISNSLWLYTVNDSKLTSESKSISISPVIMGIKKNKAAALDLINKPVTNNDLLNLIREKKIKYIMSSVTQTNDGACSYLGFLNALAGSPEVLTEEMLDSEKLAKDMKDLFNGVERVSGEQDFLEEMFVRSSDFEAVIASESSLISINKKLRNQNKEELYLIYPTDGVPINDSTLAFIDHYEVASKKENYLKLQKYLRSKEGQDKLKSMGRRTWYGGVSTEADKSIFNTEWGIDTTKYLTGTKFPSKKVITKAINLYIEQFRKPSHTVFCLDYSGSMYGDGNRQLVEAMAFILDKDKASESKLQFSKYDKITVLPFSSKVLSVINTTNGTDTADMIKKIRRTSPSGSTALYDCTIQALDILNKEGTGYTKTIVAMTDGEINVGSFKDLSAAYSKSNKPPIYSIMFGYARRAQLDEIARLSNAKVFDGQSDLLAAFKAVRGYN